MATAILLPAPELQFCDANGLPYAGGTIETYLPGTTTPKQTWVDPGEAALNTNPVILDAAGRCILYGDGQYRIILRDAAGNLIYDQPSSTVVSAAMYPVVSAPTIADAQVLLGITGFATSADLASAISTEQTARIAADSNEANTRASGDAYLQSLIDALTTRVTALEGSGGGLPLVQGGSAISDSDGHKTITYPTSYSAQPAVVVSAAGAGYGAECIVVNSNTNTHFDVWFAFPATSSPVPVGPINFDWVATGPA